MTFPKGHHIRSSGSPPATQSSRTTGVGWSCTSTTHSTNPSNTSQTTTNESQGHRSTESIRICKCFARIRIQCTLGERLFAFVSFVLTPQKIYESTVVKTVEFLPLA